MKAIKSRVHPDPHASQRRFTESFLPITHIHPGRGGLAVCFLVYRGGNRDPEQSSDLPQASQQVDGEGRSETPHMTFPTLSGQEHTLAEDGHLLGHVQGQDPAPPQRNRRSRAVSISQAQVMQFPFEEQPRIGENARPTLPLSLPWIRVETTGSSSIESLRIFQNHIEA